MQLTVNGSPTELLDATTVADLVAGRVGEDPRRVAVARNGEVVPRSRWADTLLSGGDAVELLTAAAGG